MKKTYGVLLLVVLGAIIGIRAYASIIDDYYFGSMLAHDEYRKGVFGLNWSTYAVLSLLIGMLFVPERWSTKLAVPLMVLLVAVEIGTALSNMAGQQWHLGEGRRQAVRAQAIEALQSAHRTTTKAAEAGLNTARINQAQRIADQIRADSVAQIERMDEQGASDSEAALSFLGGSWILYGAAVLHGVINAWIGSLIAYIMLMCFGIRMQLVGHEEGEDPASKPVVIERQSEAPARLGKRKSGPEQTTLRLTTKYRQYLENGGGKLSRSALKAQYGISSNGTASKIKRLAEEQVAA